MSPVIVFLDANTLMHDPMCTGAVWQILAHAPDSWNLRLITSEVAVAEAVSGYERAVAEQIKTLEKVCRSWGRLGMTTEAKAIGTTLARRIQEYPAYLQSTLAAAGVVVREVPDVSHMRVVARSAARRRPCDQNGNGYRDTLIWLTALDVVAGIADEDFVLVTNDSDFMDEAHELLHQDLLDDLARLQAAERVRLAKTLGDLVLELGGRKNEELHELRSDLEIGTVHTYLAALSGSVLEKRLDRKRCALPRVALGSLIQGIGELRDLAYTLKGDLSEGDAVAEFAFEADTQILLALPSGAALDAYEATFRVDGSEENLFVISKPLVFRGVFTLGRFHTPLTGEITQISARSDDKGHAEWRLTDPSALVELFKDIKINAVSDLFKGVDTSVTANLFNDIKINAVSDLFKGVDTSVTANLFNDIKINPAADLFKGVDTSVTANLFNDIKINPVSDLFKGVDTSVTANLFKDIKINPAADLIKGIDASVTPKLFDNTSHNPTRGVIGSSTTDLEAGPPQNTGEPAAKSIDAEVDAGPARDRCLEDSDQAPGDLTTDTASDGSSARQE